MRRVSARVVVKCLPSAVFKALIEPEKLKDWWGVERCLIQPIAGGAYVLTWHVSQFGFGYVSTGQIAEIVPDQVLRVANYIYLNPEREILGPMELTFRLKNLSGQCEVSVVQDNYQQGTDWDWYFSAVNEAWPKALEKLKIYLEKRDNR